MSQWLMFSAEAQMSEKPFSDGLPEAFRRASGCFFEKSSIPEPIFRAENCGNKKIRLSLHPQQGGLAQLARALAWHARGHEFESRILHQETTQKIANPCKSRIYRDFYFGQNAEKGIEKRVTCGLFGVLFPGPKKYTELLVTDWFAPVCSGLPLDMRHLGN